MIGASGGDTSLVSHLTELRNRLLKSLAAVAAVFLCLFPFAGDIYTRMAAPLTRHLPQGSSMVAIEVASPFLAPFKLTLLVALMLALPYVMYQAWAFVAPGLYNKEKGLAVPLLVSSVALFYTGMAFAYFVVFPLMFAFFVAVAPTGVAVMTDIGRYLDFVMTIFIAFGVAFEVPVATFLLVRMGTVSVDGLARKRPYVIVGAFIAGMALTPPDVISQVLLAVPIWLLFECGLLLSRVFANRRKAAADAPPGDLAP